MGKRVISPEMLDRLAEQSASLSESQALAAQADRLRGLAVPPWRPHPGLPILRN